MPEFRYSVLDSKGQSLSGVIDAENEEICRNIIAQRGLFCLNIYPASFASRSISIGGKKVKVKTKDLSIFCRQFSTMLNSGISIIKCLDILHNQTEKPDFKAVIKRICESVQRGQGLSASLSAQKGTFPDIMVNMIESGEASGSLDKVMDKLALHFEKSVKTDGKVKSAMIYPIILGTLTVGVVLLLMVFVLPVFTEMYKTSGTVLPMPTRIVMGVSNSLTGYWYIYLITIGILYLAFTGYLKNKKGRYNFDKLKTTIPMAGKLNSVVLSARFARTLSTMMQSGISLIKSLEITSRVLGNKYFESKISEAIDDIKKGVPLSAAIKKVDIFPLMMLSMISIGEESGSIDDVLNKTANFYDEESDTAISKLVGMLEPIMIIVMAVLVGFIIVAIIMPMYGSMMTIS